MKFARLALMQLFLRSCGPRRRAGERTPTMDPIMCPFCGGTNLFQDDDYGLELDTEYWTIHHWECMDCAQSFDKIDVLPANDAFEEINESTIH